ncbi:MFS transporter [bacterium]|nr:MFS transporter [bacterium]
MINETSMNLSISSTSKRIWFTGASFVLFQFFLQLSSGVVIGEIMHDMQLSALAAGALSSSFYIIYTSLQVPVGILFDRNNARHLLTINALICTTGCFVFAHSFSFTGLILGRTLIGAGSAFAFVGLTHLIRQHFRINHFAFIIGLSETLGFIATVLGIIGMGAFINLWGWRSFINGAVIFGILITGLCWRYIPNEPPSRKPKQNYGNQLLCILKNKKIWINGLFIGLTFAIVTVFGALWAVPFIQVKLGCSMREASLVNALFFLGTGLSCPLFGWLSNYFSKRNPLILCSCLITTLLLFGVLYIPTQNLTIMACLMFLVGLCCGSYILSYPIANELAPENGLSTCTGFINTLALVTTPILQPFIGYLLDASSSTPGVYTLTNYQHALLIMPGLLLIACILVCYLPEKRLA